MIVLLQACSAGGGAGGGGGSGGSGSGQVSPVLPAPAADETEMLEGTVSWIWAQLVPAVYAAPVVGCTSTCQSSSCVTLEIFDASGNKSVACSTDLLSNNGLTTFRFKMAKNFLAGRIYKISTNLNGSARSYLASGGSNSAHLDIDTSTETIFKEKKITRALAQGIGTEKEIMESASRFSIAYITQILSNNNLLDEQSGVTLRNLMELQGPAMEKVADYLSNSDTSSQTLNDFLVANGSSSVNAIKANVRNQVDQKTDSDGDGVSDADDCEKYNSAHWKFATFPYADMDQDGYHSNGPVTTCIGSSNPFWAIELRNSKGLDCDDYDNRIYVTTNAPYIDRDRDGKFVASPSSYCGGLGGYGAPSNVRFSLPQDQSVDCDDNNASIWRVVTAAKIQDKDGDGYAGAVLEATQARCVGQELPSDLWTAYVMDCDDNDNKKLFNVNYWKDQDQDKYTTGNILTVCTNTMTVPSGYSASSLGTDCDDRTATKFKNYEYLYLDEDGDGATRQSAGSLCAGDTQPKQVSKFRGWADDPDDANPYLPSRSPILNMALRSSSFNRTMGVGEFAGRFMDAVYAPGLTYAPVSKRWIMTGVQIDPNAFLSDPTYKTGYSVLKSLYMGPDYYLNLGFEGIIPYQKENIVDTFMVPSRSGKVDLYSLGYNSLQWLPDYDPNLADSSQVRRISPSTLGFTQVNGYYPEFLLTGAAVNGVGGQREIYLVGTQSFLSSYNGGQSWSRRALSGSATPELPYGLHACSDGNLTHVYVMYRDSSLRTPGLIYHTTDGFQTREVLLDANSGLNGAVIVSNLAINGCGDNANIYVLTNKGLMRSLDGGKSFQVVNDGQDLKDFDLVAIAKTATSEVLALSSTVRKEVALSGNQGQNYRILGLDFPLPYLTPVYEDDAPAFWGVGPTRVGYIK